MAKVTLDILREEMRRAVRGGVVGDRRTSALTGIEIEDLIRWAQSRPLGSMDPRAGQCVEALRQQSAEIKRLREALEWISTEANSFADATMCAIHALEAS